MKRPIGSCEDDCFSSTVTIHLWTYYVSGNPKHRLCHKREIYILKINIPRWLARRVDKGFISNLYCIGVLTYYFPFSTLSGRLQ